jgi:hypothetical protein
MVRRGVAARSRNPRNRCWRRKRMLDPLQQMLAWQQMLDPHRNRCRCIIAAFGIDRPSPRGGVEKFETKFFRTGRRPHGNFREIRKLFLLRGEGGTDGWEFSDGIWSR